MEFEGQLAVAKSEKALMSLAQFISDNDENDGEFYWIGQYEKCYVFINKTKFEIYMILLVLNHVNSILCKLNKYVSFKV